MKCVYCCFYFTLMHQPDVALLIYTNMNNHLFSYCMVTNICLCLMFAEHSCAYVSDTFICNMLTKWPISLGGGMCSLDALLVVQYNKGFLFYYMCYFVSIESNYIIPDQAPHCFPLSELSNWNVIQ